MLQKFKQELHNLANPEKAKILQRFFKTWIGEYWEWDIFLWITVPIQRKIVKKYFKDLNFLDIQNLLDSKIHEERFCWIISLVEKYKIGNFEAKKDIFGFYIKNAKKINNWDLVDLSAPNIVGDYLMNYWGKFFDFNAEFLISGEWQEVEKWQKRDFELQYKVDSWSSQEWQKEVCFEWIDFSTSSKWRKKMEFNINAEFPISRKWQGNKEILYRLAKSENLWERRIAIISTLVFIRKWNFQDTTNLTKILLTDKHDLIQKACGWMLREVGKRDLKVLRDFLDKNIKNMPRTMLRYAIEKMNENERKGYLKK